MRPRIAIPIPHSSNPNYAARSLPQYELALKAAGGDPVRIPVDRPTARIQKLIDQCDAVLLPGSPADVDPQRYKAVRHPKTAPADVQRDSVDRMLLDDAYKARKPVLGICYGQQSLNVHRNGSLIQHIESAVSHETAGQVTVAHVVEVDPASRLARILEEVGAQLDHLPVNSSHHQSVDVPGEGLRIVSRCPDDGIVEALEGEALDHFVLAVQWHPERSVNQDEVSLALFRAFIGAARQKQQEDAGR